MQAKVLVLLALVAVALAENVEGPKNVEAAKEAAPSAVADDTKKGKRGLLDLGIGYASPYTVVSGPSVVTSGVHTNTIITKEVPVVVHQPVAVPVEKPVPVIQKVAVPVDRPIAIQVPKPVAVEVSKPVPVPVPVAVPVVKHVPAPYPVLKHFAVQVPLTHTYFVEKQHSPVTTYTLYN